MENKILIFRTSITKKVMSSASGSFWHNILKSTNGMWILRDWEKNIKNRVQWRHCTRNFGNTPE